jgi:hypothetical protein
MIDNPSTLAPRVAAELAELGWKPLDDGWTSENGRLEIVVATVPRGDGIMWDLVEYTGTTPDDFTATLSPPGGTDEQALIDAIIGWELPAGTLLPASMHSAAIARDAAELARNLTAPGGATALLGGAA